jgi:hypothetical protein
MKQVQEKKSVARVVAMLLLAGPLVTSCGKSITDFKVESEYQACGAIVNEMVDYIQWFTPEDSKLWYIPPYWFGEPSDVTRIIYHEMFPADRKKLRELILSRNGFLNDVKYDTATSDLDYGFLDLRATLFESFFGPVFSEEQRKIISAGDSDTRTTEDAFAALEILKAAEKKYLDIDCSDRESEINVNVWSHTAPQYKHLIWDEIKFDVFDEVMIRWEALQNCESRDRNNQCNT